MNLVLMPKRNVFFYPRRSRMSFRLFSLAWFVGVLTTFRTVADEPTQKDVAYGSVGDISLQLQLPGV